MEKFFHLAAAKTSVRQELIAGLTTFLAMIYIVPVNANIMSIAGYGNRAYYDNRNVI